LIVSAGYISYQEQEDLYTSTLKLLGGGWGLLQPQWKKPASLNTRPGLPLTLPMMLLTAKPTKEFANTPAGQWLAAHAHEYGFILRYPNGKEIHYRL
jgi:D-alanyl-D-alanine carboxypeptidase